MLKENRIQEILGILEKENEVQTAELSKRFNVSEMTIRRDIDLLSKDTAIIRTRGGAYLAPASQRKEPSYTYRLRKANDVKDKISAKAAALMNDCLNVYIDSGTTTEYLFKNINDKRRYMIVTNGINIAQESIHHSHVSTFLIGGEFRMNTLSTTGPATEEQIRQFRYDIAFLGANAIDVQGNAYVGTTSEVGVKKSVIQNSSQCYILADSSKFNKYSLTSYVNIREISGVVTDSGLPRETLTQLEDNGICVIIVD